MPILKNVKQELFCQRRAAYGDSLLQAYNAAGYGNANQTTKQKKVAAAQVSYIGNVKARIAELQTTLETNAIQRDDLYTKNEVIEGLLSNAREASRSVPVLDRKGNETGEYTANFGASNKAWELLGKELGMFATVRRVQHEDLDPLADASEEALMEYLVTAAGKLGWRIDRDALFAALETRTPQANGSAGGGAEVPAGDALPAVS